MFNTHNISVNVSIVKIISKLYIDLITIHLTKVILFHDFMLKSVHYTMYLH